MNATKGATKAEIARLFGVSVQAIDGWLARGLPYMSRPDRPGASYRFDPRAVVAWRVEYLTAAATAARGDVDLEEAKRRKVAAEAELAELDLAERRRDLIPADDVEAWAASAFARVRARLLSVPAKCAPLASTAATTAQAEAAIRDAVCEALAELSETSVADLCGPGAGA
jgi:phage terminase Nu1 subunit (DNA packaging protein)